jgi:signal transduction histidine kinase
MPPLGAPPEAATTIAGVPAPTAAVAAALAPRPGAIDVFVELLSELDTGAAPQDFYSRVCEALLRLTSMERCGLFLYDPARHWVSAVGCAGVDPALLEGVGGRLRETPAAQVALREDRVVEISENLEQAIPARYARFAGITTLTITAVAAAGHWFGVIFADRGGGRFTLTDEERHAMWTLGKLAAVVESARVATRHQERARMLGERIDLAREIHERVMQRLFGVSLVLDSDHELTPAQRRRCGEELGAALGDLRSALGRPLAPAPRETSTTLRAELERLARGASRLPVTVRWRDGVELPGALEPLAQSILAEALRNARKHARPSEVRIDVCDDGGALVVEILNDGVRRPGRGEGMGLRLAGLEAIQHGGVLEHGSAGEGRWRVRLAVPLVEEAG